MLSTINNITLRKTTGICAPPWGADVPWPLWVECETLKTPKTIRFAWCPLTGSCWAGVQVDHRLLLSPQEKQQVAVVLLGYTFPLIKAVAVKGVYCDLKGDVVAHSAQEVIESFVSILKPTLPTSCHVYTSTQNPFLMSRMSRVSI